MVKGLNRQFLQRRYLNGQQAHENVLNITDCKGKVNQNHNKISHHTYQNNYHQKTQQIARVCENVEKREPS